MPTLRPRLLEIGDSIDARGEINPSRRVCCGESVVSCRGAEVHHHLPCWFDSLTEQLRKHRRQPGPTCKHEESATQLRPIHQAQSRYSSGHRWLPRSSSTDEDSFARELGGQCLNRASCHHDTALGFEHRQCDTVRNKVRIARADCSLVEDLNRVVTVLKRRESFGRVRIDRPEPSTARHMGATDASRSRSAPRARTTARVTAGRSENRSRPAHTHSAGCETRRPNSTVNCRARTHRRASRALRPLSGDGPSTPKRASPNHNHIRHNTIIVGRVLLVRPGGRRLPSMQLRSSPLGDGLSRPDPRSRRRLTARRRAWKIGESQWISDLFSPLVSVCWYLVASGHPSTPSVPGRSWGHRTIRRSGIQPPR